MKNIDFKVQYGSDKHKEEIRNNLSHIMKHGDSEDVRAILRNKNTFPLNDDHIHAVLDRHHDQGYSTPLYSVVAHYGHKMNSSHWGKLANHPDKASVQDAIENHMIPVQHVRHIADSTSDVELRSAARSYIRKVDG